MEETQLWLDRMIESEPEWSADFVVEYEGRVIGKAGCWRIPEIGFILHPDYWSMGFAREALSALIPHVFESFHLDFIQADVDPHNAACLRLLSGLGFQEVARAEKTWLVGDAWHDSVYLELPRP